MSDCAENRPDHMTPPQLVAEVKHSREERDRLSRLYETEFRRAEKAEAKAAAYEKDWYDSKSEFGDAMAKARERYSKAEARVAELEAALRAVLDCHDGYHAYQCDDRESAFADAEYEHPANRPEERDCDCGDVGVRNLARAVLARATASASNEKGKTDERSAVDEIRDVAPVRRLQSDGGARGPEDLVAGGVRPVQARAGERDQERAELPAPGDEGRQPGVTHYFRGVFTCEHCGRPRGHECHDTPRTSDAGNRESDGVSVPLGPPLRFRAPPGTFEDLEEQRSNEAKPGATGWVHRLDALCPFCGRRCGDHERRHEIGFHCDAPRTDKARNADDVGRILGALICAATLDSGERMSTDGLPEHAATVALRSLLARIDTLESNAVAYRAALIETGTLREALQEIAHYVDPNATVEDDFRAVQRIAEDALEATKDEPRSETPEKKP